MSMRSRFTPMLCALILLLAGVPAGADNLPEYRLKAAFLYNFAVFTEWPAEIGDLLNLCVYGEDPFGGDLDQLQGKAVGPRSIAIHRLNSVDSMQKCQLVFVTRSVIDNLPRVLATLGDAPVLTVADSPGASQQGVALNMNVVENKIVFDANLGAAHRAGLSLSSKLLRLANMVSP